MKNRTKYYVEKDGIFCHGTIIFLALSCVFCIIGSIGRWYDEFFIVAQVVLPVVCSILFIFFLLLFGKKHLWLTCFPAVIILAFFVIKSSEYNSLAYTIISIVMSVISVFIYSAVSFGWMKKKWLLILALTVGFFFHLYVKDYLTLMLLDPNNSISFQELMHEISLLFIILAALSTALAMKNKMSIEEMNLPKMRTPKIIVNKDSNADTPETVTDKNESLPAQEEAIALPTENTVNDTAENTGNEKTTDGAGVASETPIVGSDAQILPGYSSESVASNNSKDDTGAIL